MAEQKTRGDSIRAYLSGGAFDGDYQQELSLSIGGYRSAFHVLSRGFVRNSPIRGIAVEEVSGNCSVGGAKLSAVAGTRLRFTPFGGEPGDEVSIAAGETKLIEGADGSWVRVRRLEGALSMAVLSGTETLDIAPVFGNGIGGPDVSGSQASDGLVDYGCVFLKNESSASLDSATISASADYGMRIAVETPVSGSVQSQADRETAPTGLTWSDPYASPVTVSNWEAGGLRALRIERTTPAGAAASAHSTVALDIEITIGADTFHNAIDGRYRVAAAWDEQFEAWVGQDAEPDVSASPYAVSSTRPFALPALAYGHEYYIRTGRRNKYGLLMLDEASTRVRVLDSGVEGALPPSEPSEMAILGLQDGSVEATGLYYAGLDSGYEADGASLWIGLGADPAPATDDPVVFGTLRGQAAESVRLMATGPYQDGCDLRGLLRTFRLATAVAVSSITRAGATATVSATAHGMTTGDWVNVSGAVQDEYNGYFKITVTDANTFAFTVTGTPATPGTGTITVSRLVFSENTAAVQATMLTKGPVRAAGLAMLGRAAALQQTVAHPAASTTWIDQAKNVRLECSTGSASLYCDAALVWRAIYDSVETSRNGLYLPSDWSLYNDAVSGVGTEGIEIGSWDPSNRVLYVTPRGGTRKAKIDATSKLITLITIDQYNSPAWSTFEGPVWSRWDGVFFQIYDAGLSTWVTFLSVNDDGDFQTTLPINQTNTQSQIEAM